MTDTELTALLAKVDALESEEDDGDTWWDLESRHGRLAALYLEAGWEGCYDISHIPGAVPFNGAFKVWQCGRSGGYLNAPDVEDDPRIMLQLAYIARQSRDYFNGADWGKYLAETAIEEDRERELAKLASPRPDRVEA